MSLAAVLGILISFPSLTTLPVSTPAPPAASIQDSIPATRGQQAPEGQLVMRFLEQPVYRNGETARFVVADSKTGKNVDISKVDFKFDPPGWGKVDLDPEDGQRGILTVVDSRLDPLRGGTFRITCEYHVRMTGGSDHRIDPNLRIRPGNMLIELNVLSSLVPDQHLDLARYQVTWSVEPATCSVEMVQGQHWLFVPAALIDQRVRVTARFETGQTTMPLELCPKYLCPGSGVALTVDPTPPIAPIAEGIPWQDATLEHATMPFRYEKRTGDSESNVRDNTVRHEEKWEARRAGTLLAIRGQRTTKVDVTGIERQVNDWSEEGTETFALTRCDGEFESDAWRMGWEGTLSYEARRKSGPIGQRGSTEELRQTTRYRGTLVLREGAKGELTGTFVIDRYLDSADGDWQDWPDKSEHSFRIRLTER